MFSVSVYLYCDANLRGCECEVVDADSESRGFMEASSGDSPHETKKSYKAEAKKQGWVFKGTKAYCPLCWEMITAERNIK